MDRSFNFIADFACLMCAPDTSSFIEREGEKLHVSLCSGWCADFHRACAKTPYFGNVGDDEADMCEYAISLWNREDAFDIVRLACALILLFAVYLYAAVHSYCIRCSCAPMRQCIALPSTNDGARSARRHGALKVSARRQ